MWLEHRLPVVGALVASNGLCSPGAVGAGFFQPLQGSLAAHLLEELRTSVGYEVSFLPLWFGLVLLVWTCWRKASPIPNLINLVKQCEVLLPSAGFFSLVPGRQGFISGSFQDSGSLKERACDALRGVLLLPEHMQICSAHICACAALLAVRDSSRAGDLQRCAAWLCAEPPCCQHSAATGKGCPSLEQL